VRILIGDLPRAIKRAGWVNDIKTYVHIESGAMSSSPRYSARPRRAGMLR